MGTTDILATLAMSVLDWSRSRTVCIDFMDNPFHGHPADEDQFRRMQARRPPFHHSRCRSSPTPPASCWKRRRRSVAGLGAVPVIHHTHFTIILDVGPRKRLSTLSMETILDWAESMISDETICID